MTWERNRRRGVFLPLEIFVSARVYASMVSGTAWL